MTTIYGPAPVNFTGTHKILQGATYDVEITLTLGGTLNLSAYAGTAPRCQFRTPTFSSGTVFLTPVMSWIDASIAKMRIRIEAATTAAIAMGSSLTIDGVHDIEVVNGLDVLRVAEGTWTLSAEVTR